MEIRAISDFTTEFNVIYYPELAYFLDQTDWLFAEENSFKKYMIKHVKRINTLLLIFYRVLISPEHLLISSGAQKVFKLPEIK